jgi:hypothetical protein
MFLLRMLLLVHVSLSCRLATSLRLLTIGATAAHWCCCRVLLFLQMAAFSAKPDPKLVHVLSSGLKAAATWSRVEILQHCR